MSKRAAAQDAGAPVTVVRIGGDAEYSDPSGAWTRLSEIGEDGALLVRPDNHIAWRATTGADAANLQTTLSRSSW